jgi:hypothetical protein
LQRTQNRRCIQPAGSSWNSRPNPQQTWKCWRRDRACRFQTVAPPTEIYVASTQPYNGLPELDYPFQDRDILVTGRICLYRKKINISSVLAGQRLGIKEVDDGIWLVSFSSYDLGYFDLEQKTLQPLDNPFGPRLSPMS